LNDYGISQNSCRVLITGNKGRDILPWLSISEDLEKYDIVGHFHTKKTSWTQEWIGESWLRGIMASLIVPAPAIIEMLMLENEVGIVIPDAPFHYSYLSHSDTWGKNRLQCQSLWNTMKNMKYVNFDILRTPVMSYGNMFWYKPKALKPLFDLKLTDSDFPEEPLSNDGTIAHAIERLPVYIAWSGGFDFRIAVGVNDLKTTLEIKEMLKRKNSAQNFQYGKRKFNLVIKISRKILRAFKL
jgi:rhamnosyltransferase